MTGVERAPIVSVVGGSPCSEEDAAAARALGGALAARGAVVVCGGRGGVMEAVSRGADEAGGLTIGLLPGAEPAEANAWIRVALATGLGEARNALVARAAEAMVAVGGGWGTLSEIALARKMGVDVAVLGRAPAEGLDLPRFGEPDEAAAWAVARAQARRGRRA